MGALRALCYTAIRPSYHGKLYATPTHLGSVVRLPPPVPLLSVQIKHCPVVIEQARSQSHDDVVATQKSVQQQTPAHRQPALKRKPGPTEEPDSNDSKGKRQRKSEIVVNHKRERAPATKPKALPLKSPTPKADLKSTVQLSKFFNVPR